MATALFVQGRGAVAAYHGGRILTTRTRGKGVRFVSRVNIFANLVRGNFTLHLVYRSFYRRIPDTGVLPIATVARGLGTKFFFGRYVIGTSFNRYIMFVRGIAVVLRVGRTIDLVRRMSRLGYGSSYVPRYTLD